MEILIQIGITVLTTLLSIAVLFLLEKMMGSKQVSQMTMFDYAIGITIGSIAAELATELEEPARPLTALVVYGIAAVGISVLTSKSLKARAVVTGKPLALLENGVIYRDNLKKARLDLSEFLTYCRIGGWFDLNQLQAAVLEHNGAVSLRKRTAPPHPRTWTCHPSSPRCRRLSSWTASCSQTTSARRGKRRPGSTGACCTRVTGTKKRCCWPCGTAAKS